MAYDRSNSILRIRCRFEPVKIFDGRVVQRVVFNPLATLESSDGLIQQVTVDFSELGFGGINAGVPTIAGAGEVSRVGLAGDGPILVLEGGDSRFSQESPFTPLHQIVDPSVDW